MLDIKFMLSSLYAVYNVPMSCFEEQEFIFSTDSEFEINNSSIYNSKLIKNLIKEWDGSPFLKLEKNNVMYGVCQDPNKTVCVVGPVALNPLNSEQLYDYQVEHNLPKKIQIQCTSIVKVAALLALLHWEMNGIKFNFYQIIEQLNLDPEHDKITEKDLFDYSFQNSEQSKDSISPSIEKKILNAISRGDLETIKTMLAKPYLNERVGQMASNVLKQTEYIAVSGITLFTRAAIDGGVNFEEAYNLSDLYIQKVSAAKDELRIYEIIKNASLDFCSIVQNFKEKKYESKYIRQCKQYVEKHLFKRFSLADIADEISINKCYLTNQFSKQEGTSLKKYIHKECIKAAQNMLKFSNQPISVIANYLCFDSQSHFGAVFKSIVDMTPQNYRMKNMLVSSQKNLEV
ncbi:hypothetical protein ATX47_02240 [Oenococcus oeni]|uniref:AraC family transcriptional regulator n=1 Tax=Oenococcus oeni TaxID=1247 RepID=UPI0008F8881B|nr:AraC family transcriptional regulator [Oenococcus oeni]OIL96374.1 hypothetical protein ATX47_02240 [Oenococcus oeni]